MRLGLFSFTSLFASCVFADGESRRLAPLGAQSLFETLGGLLLIIALIVAVAWLFKRYTRLPLAGKGIISVVGGLSLGPRERVVVLQVDNTRLVVGVAPGQIRTLHILEREQEGNVDFNTRLRAASDNASFEGRQ